MHGSDRRSRLIEMFSFSREKDTDRLSTAQELTEDEEAVSAVRRKPEKWKLLL